MKMFFLIFILSVLLSGCASKMAYLNTRKPAEEMKKDKADCQSAVDAADYKDSGLKQNKFNQCMKDKGYKVVSEDQAKKIQGFNELWIKEGVDFNVYEAVFINEVDISQVKTKNEGIPDSKITDEDIKNLAQQMLERFSKTLGAVIPVVLDKEKTFGKKMLYLNLALNNIAQTNVGLSAALTAAGQVSGLPMPSAPQGTFSFSCVIADFSSKDNLIIISDEMESDKNASVLGVENFQRWQHAYNIIDYWADHLAALFAKERGQKYKSRLGLKII